MIIVHTHYCILNDRRRPPPLCRYHSSHQVPRPFLLQASARAADSAAFSFKNSTDDPPWTPSAFAPPCRATAGRRRPQPRPPFLDITYLDAVPGLMHLEKLLGGRLHVATSHQHSTTPPCEAKLNFCCSLFARRPNGYQPPGNRWFGPVSDLSARCLALLPPPSTPPCPNST
jgi:hypothetical protein